MKSKLLLILIFTSSLFSKDLVIVPVSIKKINYKEQVYGHHYKLVQLTSQNIIKYKIKCKEYLNFKALRTNKYRANHYITPNKAICKKDLYFAKSKRVMFNFGALEIERDGEVIRETDQYIKLKNLDGKVEKIYKDGRDI